MVELHSNFTAKGTKGVGGWRTAHPSRRARDAGNHHGFNEWFEMRLLPVHQHPARRQLEVGGHPHPPARLDPGEVQAAGGASLSTEFGYQRPNFDPDTWTLGNSPDRRQADRQAVPGVQSDVREVVSRAGQGLRARVFAERQSWPTTSSRRWRWAWNTTAPTARSFSWDTPRDTEQMFVPAVDVDFGKNWEFNFGVGVGVTQNTDHLLVKAILGYRFNNKRTKLGVRLAGSFPGVHPRGKDLGILQPDQHPLRHLFLLRCASPACCAG